MPAFAGMTAEVEARPRPKACRGSFRGGDNLAFICHVSVMPAKAGIQALHVIPALAGIP